MGNSYETYRICRLCCLPVRIAIFVVAGLMWPKDLNVLTMVGFIIAIILAAVDFIAGDLNELRNYKLVCSYEIFDILSERIYVCRRKGAQHYEEVYGSRGIVNELITGKT